MKLIGVDYGRRRIGLAITDETGTVVRGLATLDRKKYPRALESIRAVIAGERPEAAVQAVVFGLPLDADDRETSMAAEIRKFAADLETSIHLPVYFIDESLTSKQAEKLLRFRKKKERRNKATVDKIAACLILEAFLREQKPTIAP